MSEFSNTKQKRMDKLLEVSHLLLKTGNQYFALRDEKGSYKGVIEVSQEVSEIRALEGENRLLDW